MYTKSANKDTDFFVILDCTDKLKVPQAHPWNTERVFPETLILKDKKENTWLVELEKIDDQVCFVRGWSTFVEDNNVKIANLLVFANAGHNVLAFRLFDSKTACNTGGFSGFKFVITDEDEDKDEDFDEYKKEDDNEEEEDVKEAGFKFVITDEDEDEEEKGNSSRIGQNRRRIKDIYGEEIFKSGVIPRPQNPYFVARKWPTRPNELNVPIKFIKDGNHHLPTKTIMRDCGGKQWKTKLIKGPNGRLLYNGGWSSFCRVNDVGDDEDCICEFVEESGKGLTLFVYKVEPNV